MKVQKYLQNVLISVLVTGLAASTVCAEESTAPVVNASPVVKVSSGALVGIVTNSAKLPVAGATVTAIRVGGGIRATVSGSDGMYSFADLPPGEWTLTAEVEGYPDVAVPPLQVVASKATRHDIVMNVPPAVPPTSPSLAAAPAPAAASPSAATLNEVVPAALQSPEATTGVDTFTPFAFGDFTWLNGSPRNKAPVFDTKFFTPDIRLDVHYMADFNHPRDHTIVGSTESFRSGEFQLEQLSFGGDFHYSQ
jgi:hypothetical protein